jgi:hypothetical protein
MNPDLRAIEAALLGEPHEPSNLSPEAASVVLPLVRRVVQEGDCLKAEIAELLKPAVDIDIRGALTNVRALRGLLAIPPAERTTGERTDIEALRADTTEAMGMVLLEIVRLRRDLDVERERVDERDREASALRATIESNAEIYRLALDQQNAENFAALEEARLTLAAEQGRSEGASSDGWQAPTRVRISWRKEGPGWLIDVSKRYDLWDWDYWVLGIAAGAPTATGTAPTARAAMLAADKALFESRRTRCLAKARHIQSDGVILYPPNGAHQQTPAIMIDRLSDPDLTEAVLAIYEKALFP